MKILVVDDTRTNRSLLSWILQEAGHQVIEATNGQEGVEAFTAHQPDLVLMDVMMPVMDGYQATVAIKQHLQQHLHDTHVPIIFLTALTDDESLTKCLAIGGDDFIAKPINEQVLQAKIKAHSRILELNKELQLQHQELKRLHNYTLREHEIAKTVFEKAIQASLQDCANLRTYASPATTFNGDLVLSAYSPLGGLYVLIADFTGHGLPAAIGALPMSQVFFEMAQQGSSVGDMVSALNHSLVRFLPDDMFAVSAIVELSADGKRATLWNGGIPDILVLSSDGAIKQRLSSYHMPLGILEDDEFENDVQVLNFAPGDRLYLYTDGITEYLNPTGEMFGEARIEALIEQRPNDLFKAIIDAVHSFSTGAQNDDITLLELTAQPVNNPLGQLPEHAPSDPGSSWHFQMRIENEALRNAMPVLTITNMLCKHTVLQPHKDFLYTILTELYSNALEHGILELSSGLKDSEEGFIAYYTEREAALKRITQGRIDIELDYDSLQERPCLHITLQDSGKGFATSHGNNEDHAHGRGISLIKALCHDQIEYSNNGSRVRVTYAL
jgi:CheY-like chemotaxis protein